MSGFSNLKAPSLPSLSIEVVAPDTIRLGGTIALRDPAPEIGAFLRRAHAAALEDQLRAVSVDVSGLAFVNSSSIRMFVDWAAWVRAEPDGSRYKLRFLTSRQVTWQKTAFAALMTLAREVVDVQHVD